MQIAIKIVSPHIFNDVFERQSTRDMNAASTRPLCIPGVQTIRCDNVKNAESFIFDSQILTNFISNKQLCRGADNFKYR